MRKLNSMLKTILGLAMLSLLFVLVSSMTTAEVTLHNASVKTNHISFFDECDIEHLDLTTVGVTCGNWYRYHRTNCGCAPNSPGNSSSSYSFHRDYYKRTCWTNSAPVAYWSDFSPGVCNSVCQ